ncbi:hypothetical protein [Atopococcus tabaci]|uniref:hypothetical protein n=1 Tax=Atopococcus tabaci TaxID=269774 RepID=UPI0024093217|nr:hypothetical protein [Atopococcus tabaci]
MKKLNVQSAKREYDINGEVFALPFNDQLLEQYKEKFEAVHKKSKKDISFDEARKEVLAVVAFMFESEEEAQRLYEACGESTHILVDVLQQILIDIAETLGAKKKTRLEEYLQKK